jgi:cytosine/adenosine deaminase-related metal-dependent hydrolase
LGKTEESTTSVYSAQWVIPVGAAPIPDGAIAVAGGRIIGVGRSSEIALRFDRAAREDFGEAVILPGLINCHSHLELTAMRGYLDDVESDFFAWLRKLTIARMTMMTEDDLLVSAKWGALEAASAGITCLGDASDSGATSLRAMRELGLRGVVYQEVFGPDAASAEISFDKLRQKVEPLKMLDTPLVKVGISPHAPFTVSSRLFELVADYALAANLRLMVHAAESKAEDDFVREGKGPFTQGLLQRSIEWRAPGISSIQYLESLGVLEAAPLLAHCIRVDEDDIDTLRLRNAGIAHCPKSNAKLGHGRAPFAAFLRAGLNVGLGSDSVASNNICDIIEESRFAVMLSRAAEDEVALGEMVSGEHALEAATLGGARAMGLQERIGSLEEGKEADFVVVSLDGAHQRPNYDPYAAIVFASSGRDVQRTFVAGKEIYRSGGPANVDVERLSARIREIQQKLMPV